MWQNSRTQTVIKLKKQIVTKLERSNCDQTQKLKLCKNIKKKNCDNSKTQIVMVIKMTVVTEVVIMTSISKKHLNTLTTNQLSGQLFATLEMFLHKREEREANWKQGSDLQDQEGQDGQGGGQNIVDKMIRNTEAVKHWLK